MSTRQILARFENTLRQMKTMKREEPYRIRDINRLDILRREDQLIILHRHLAMLHLEGQEDAFDECKEHIKGVEQQLVLLRASVDGRPKPDMKKWEKEYDDQTNLWVAGLAKIYGK